MNDGLGRALASPVTTVTIVAAAVVFFFAGAGGIDQLTLDVRAFEGTPWRAFTTTLVHGGYWGDESATMGAFHLGFNAYWLWLLGAPLEARWGHVRYGVFVVLVGALSSLAEYAFLHTPVGLSGVVYGLLTARWWLTRRGIADIEALPDRTVQFLAFWFFFSIALSWSGTLPIANIAHGVGAGVGWALASVATSDGGARAIRGAAVTVVALATIYVAGPGRPLVHLASEGAVDQMQLGLRALSAGDYAASEARFEAATAFRNCPPEAWHNLGVARARQKKFAAAADAFERAAELGPGDATFRRAAERAREAAELRSSAAAPSG